MRWKLGMISFIISVLFWGGSFMAYPYTSWGFETEEVRPSIADLSFGLAMISIILAVVSAFVVLWRKSSPRGWGEIIFALALLFFGGTATARLFWIHFF